MPAEVRDTGTRPSARGVGGLGGPVRGARALAGRRLASDLRTVRVGLPAGREDYGKTGDRKQPEPVPEGFDYNRWLGPAPDAPYAPEHPARMPWAQLAPEVYKAMVRLDAASRAPQVRTRAAWGADIAAMKMLVEHGADPNIRTMKIASATRMSSSSVVTLTPGVFSSCSIKSFKTHSPLS